MRKAIGWMMCTALAGCAGTTDKNLSVEAPLYRRENAVEFRVRFIENRAVRAGVVKVLNQSETH